MIDVGVLHECMNAGASECVENKLILAKAALD
jgi:hypothetical protein